MRLLDDEHGVPTQRVSLYLTPEECRRLIASLSKLLTQPGEHFHLADDGTREISASLYEEEAVQSGDFGRYNKLEQKMFEEE